VTVHIADESVPIQLAQCRFPAWLTISSAKMLTYFEIKYTETILPDSSRELVWFEITKMQTAQSEKQRTEIGLNGESTSMVWPTLGSRTAKEHNRTTTQQRYRAKRMVGTNYMYLTVGRASDPHLPNNVRAPLTDVSCCKL